MTKSNQFTSFRFNLEEKEKPHQLMQRQVVAGQVQTAVAL